MNERRKRPRAGAPERRKEYRPVTPSDVADDNPKMLANLVRRLTERVESGFELLGNKLLVTMERMDARQDAFAADLADLRRRVELLEAKPRKSRKP